MYLNNTVILHAMYKKQYPKMNDETLYKTLMKDMFSRKLVGQRWVINTVGKPCADILHAISKQGVVDPSTMVYVNESSTKKNDLYETMSTLLDANILRYTSEGFLTGTEGHNNMNFISIMIKS